LNGTATSVTDSVISGLPLPGCTLWPPDHKLVHVATVTATDNIGLSSFNVTVTSNEPPDPWDTDFVITGIGLAPRMVQLRAERLGTGTGRIYTITATATNSAGHTTAAMARCTVPHDRR